MTKRTPSLSALLAVVGVLALAGCGSSSSSSSSQSSGSGSGTNSSTTTSRRSRPSQGRRRPVRRPPSPSCPRPCTRASASSPRPGARRCSNSPTGCTQAFSSVPRPARSRPGTGRFAFALNATNGAFVYAPTALYIARTPHSPAQGPFLAPADPMTVSPQFRSKQNSGPGGIQAIYAAQLPAPEGRHVHAPVDHPHAGADCSVRPGRSPSPRHRRSRPSVSSHPRSAPTRPRRSTGTRRC